MEISGGIDICQMSFPTGATAILLLVCILSLLSTKCPAASILRSARFSRMQTTKKPHGYHKIAVWQKDDRIRKSPLKFYAQYYSILSGDFQALIITNYFRCGHFNAEIDINFPTHGRLSPRRISVAVHKCAKNAH